VYIFVTLNEGRRYLATSASRTVLKFAQLGTRVVTGVVNTINFATAVSYWCRGGHFNSDEGSNLYVRYTWSVLGILYSVSLSSLSIQSRQNFLGNLEECVS
jgi:hypothetical protein